jgi:hypothetical protein
MKSKRTEKEKRIKRPFIRLPDFRNVERGKRELADMIRESEQRDGEKQAAEKGQSDG